MLYNPIYNPNLTFEENYESGPTGEYLTAPQYVNAGEPKYELFGHKVYLPFGVPAGPIFNSKYAKAAFEHGFDVLVYKTVRSREKKCAPFPNIVPLETTGVLTTTDAHEKGVVMTDSYKEPLAITNSFGVPSVSPDVWQSDMKKAVQRAGKGQLLIGAFQGTNRGGGENEFIVDHVLCARLVKHSGAKVLEVNTSCPNEGTSNLLCFDTKRMEKIMKAIKEEIGDTPLIVKLAYFEDDAALHDLVHRIGDVVDGFSAINTIGAKVYRQDGIQALPGEGRLYAGVCGAPIKWAGLDMVARLKRLRDKLGLKYSIIGVGGVTTFTDYNEYVDAGADCVLSATGMMWNPYLAEEIKTELFVH